MNLDALCRWLGWLLMAGFIALTVAEVIRYFRSALVAPEADRAPEGQPVPAHRLLMEVLAAFVASRVLVVAVCAAAYLIEGYALSGFLSAFADKLKPWDAQHYVDIITDGYVAESEARLFIVFFPLYPMICRTITFMTGFSAYGVATAVSNAALVGCGYVMYRLVEPEGGATLGRRAMLLLMFNPMTYFFSITYSESVFLLVTLLAVLMARRGRFAAAVALEALASSARLLGMATAVPLFWELLRAWRSEHPEARGADVARGALLCVLKVLPVSLGFLMYLSINWHLFGNPTQFMIFQSEHWYQNFGTIANTFQYSLVNSIRYDDHLYQLGVWRPQVALLIAVPLLIWWRRHRERAGDTAYALVYHYVAFQPTWLLSGPRYAACCYALYPLLARLPGSRRGFIALLAAECALLCYMTYLGLWCVKVY